MGSSRESLGDPTTDTGRQAGRQWTLAAIKPTTFQSEGGHSTGRMSLEERLRGSIHLQDVPSKLLFEVLNRANTFGIDFWFSFVIKRKK